MFNFKERERKRPKSFSTTIAITTPTISTLNCIRAAHDDGAAAGPAIAASVIARPRFRVLWSTKADSSRPVKATSITEDGAYIIHLQDTSQWGRGSLKSLTSCENLPSSLCLSLVSTSLCPIFSSFSVWPFAPVSLPAHTKDQPLLANREAACS